jgi:hypothetical protein
MTRDKLPHQEIHLENAGYIIPLWVKAKAPYTENFNSLQEQILSIAHGFA